MTNLFEAVRKIAKENPEGFTVKIPNLEWVTDGFVVAYFETQNCFGDEGLWKVLEHAEQHDKIVGGWLNEENLQFYFDSSKVFTSMKEAIEFGRKNKQISIFDLNTFTEIRL